MPPKWSDRPATRQKKPTADLLRVPTAGSLRGIITSVAPIGAYTHFFNNRTMPCSTDDCPACTAKMLPRWLGYIAVWSPKTNKHAILELTANAATPIFNHIDAGKTLRGQHFTAERKGNRPNGRVTLTIEGDASPAYAIPQELPITEILRTIWDLEEAAEGRESPKYRETAITELETRNGRKPPRP